MAPASGKSKTVVSRGGGQEIGGEQRKDKKAYGQSETLYFHWGGVWEHKRSLIFHTSQAFQFHDVSLVHLVYF
jgi:hypothetical protein